MKKDKQNNNPPVIAEWLLKKMTHYEDSFSSVDNFKESYAGMIDSKGFINAYLWYWRQVILSMFQYLKFQILWSIIMIKNYLKIAFRNINRYKSYSFINIAGLSIGMACSLFVLLYVKFELSYDDYHNDTERIYRIANEQVTANGKRYYSGVVPVMGPELKSNFPQIEQAARLERIEPKTVKYGDNIYFEDKLAWADQEIFDMFTIEFVSGVSDDALTRPMTAVITEDVAARYFGDEEPYGKTLKVDIFNFEITGVIKNSPENTHYKFGIISSYKTLLLDEESEMYQFYGQWTTGMHSAHTYIKIAQNTDIPAFTELINRFIYGKLKEELSRSGYKHNYFLQPFMDIHLKSNLRGEAEPPGNLQYIYIFSIIGIFILIISSINYMNLSTARAANRTGEIGIRKVVGAARSQLFRQFIGESMLLSIIAFCISTAIICLTMPLYNDFLGGSFKVSDLFRLKIVLSAAIIALLTGIFAGSYPAFLLSAFKPLSVLKNSFRAGKLGAMVRKILVIGQISISVMLIIGTLIILRQVNYMKNETLGFDKKQKLIINLPRLSMMTEIMKR